MDLTERLRFFTVDDQTKKDLAEFAPRLEKALPPIVAAFYEHLSAYSDLMALFDNEASIERAKSAQIAHW